MPTPFLLNGILASQISGHLYAGPAGAFDALGSVTLSGTQASITFSAIPQTYTHLQLRYIAKNAYSASNGVDDPNFSFNTDTTYTNYRSHYLEGNGSSTFAGSIQTSGTYAIGAGVARSYTGETNMFSAGITDILDYANTNKYKTVRSLGGADYNGSGEVHFHSAMWMNTAGIYQIDINCGAGSFVAGTQFSLYGIR